MARGEAGGDSAATAGVIGSLRNLAATAVGIVQTRLQLLANDLEEQRLRALQMLVLGAIALFCGAMAVVLVTAFLIIALWEQYRLWTLGLLVLVYAGGCVLTLAMLKSRAAERPRMFSASIAELRRDRDSLRP